jgi:hypothetical protein
MQGRFLGPNINAQSENGLRPIRFAVQSGLDIPEKQSVSWTSNNPAGNAILSIIASGMNDSQPNDQTQNPLAGRR